MTEDQARPLYRGDLGLPIYQDEVQDLEAPTIDLVAALVAREGVRVVETDAATVITVPRQYPAVAKAEIAPSAALNKAEIRRILDVILDKTNVDDNLDVYRELSELISAIDDGDFDFRASITADLVAELRTREGVEALDIDPDEDYEVSKSDPFCEHGTLDPVWSETGPATLLKVVD